MSTQFSFPFTFPVAGISANGSGPAVLNMGYFNELYFMLNVTAKPVGGAPTLDIFIQSSTDQGTDDGTTVTGTWQDMIRFPQVTTTLLKRFAQVAGRVAGGATTIAPSDGLIAADTVVQGAWGDRLRVKWLFAAGGSAGAYTIALWATPKGMGI